LRAMADPVRTRILYALTVEPLCVCELSRLLEMSMPAVSHHVRILTMTGLLKVREEGKFACYYLHNERLTRALRALLQAWRLSIAEANMIFWPYRSWVSKNQTSGIWS